MKCRSVQRRFTIEGGRRAVREEDRSHLVRCTRCSAYVHRDEAVRRLLAGARAPDPGPGFEARLLRRIHAAAEQEAVGVRWARMDRRLAFAAAAVLVVAFGWYGWGRRGGAPAPVAVPVMATAEREPENAPAPPDPVPLQLESLVPRDFFVVHPPRPSAPPSAGTGDRPASRARMVVFEEAQP